MGGTTSSSARAGSDDAATTASTAPAAEAASRKQPINLHRGWPNTSLLPVEPLKRAADAALSDPSIFTPASALLYAPDPGRQELREALASWLGDFYGEPLYPSMSSSSAAAASRATADQITITGGASQSLANILASFTDPSYTRAVWMVAPCYFLACPIMADAGGFGSRMRAVPEDDEGMDVEYLASRLREMDGDHKGGRGKDGEEEGGGGEVPLYKDPRPYRKIYRHVIYCVPTFSNPSGKTMSLRRREDLVRLAREHDALVVADDVYDMLQWPVGGTSTITTTTTTTTTGSRDQGSDSSSSSDKKKNLDLNRALLPRLVDIDLALGPSRYDNALATTPTTTPPTTTTTDNSTGNKKQEPQHFGHAISNGSFSKLAGPGLRTGWTQSTADFALGLSQTGATRSGGAPSQITAAVLCKLLRAGDLQREIETSLRPAYQRRHRMIVDAVREFLVEPLGVGVRETSLVEEARVGGGGGGHLDVDVFGGYFIWLTLPVRGDDGKPFPGAKAIAGRCKQDEELIIGHGGMFEVHGDEEAVKLDHAIRLCFSWEEEENLVEGVKRLGRVIQNMLSEDPTSWAQTNVTSHERGGVNEEK